VTLDIEAILGIIEYRECIFLNGGFMAGYLVDQGAKNDLGCVKTFF
jgi:hypothetical protein